LFGIAYEKNHLSVSISRVELPHEFPSFSVVVCERVHFQIWVMDTACHITWTGFELW